MADGDDEDYAYSVELVIDSASLDNLLDRNQDEAVLFFFFWLREKRTKAVVPKKGRERFIASLEEKAKENPEVYNPIISFYRGYTTPYRFKYVEEAGISLPNSPQYNDDMQEEEIIINVSNWHYATVRYVVVNNPKTYEPERMPKLNPQNITDINGFYKLISAEDIECVQTFRSSLELHIND